MSYMICELECEVMYEWFKFEIVIYTHCESSFTLLGDVKLRISTCLGPCSKKNVSILKVGQSRIWLGSLGEDAHYEALVDWAKNISNKSSDSDLPDILKPLQFTP